MRIQARLALAFLLAGSLLSAAWADDEKFGAPKKFTMALGDSLAFGFQRHKFDRNPGDLAQFHTGFAFVFAERVARTAPGKGAQLLNLGCPGETTASFLNGPCAYHAVGAPLHFNYAGAQMDAAEDLLRSNRGQISPILISLGANDALGLLAFCQGRPPACVSDNLPDVLRAVGYNLTLTLSRLRTVAPDAEILLLQVYNPLAAIDPGTNQVALALNGVIGSVASANRARVANAFPAFNLAPPQPQTLCMLTLFCAAGDIHASDAGYAVIADLMFEAAGYTRFEH